MKEMGKKRRLKGEKRGKGESRRRRKEGKGRDE